MCSSCHVRKRTNSRGLGRMLTALGLCCVATLFIVRTAVGDAESDFATGRDAFARGDVITAIDRLGAAADAGHVPAMIQLAYVLNKAGDNEAAFHMYRRAADAGSLEAVLAVGVLYANGDGIEINQAEAFAWIRRAAEAGHPPAMVALANVYRDGTLGIPEDRAAAERWFSAAAQAGYAPAQQALDQLRKPSQTRHADDD